MAEQYTYAVARVRARETALLTEKDLDMLLSAKTYDEALRILADKGFSGNGDFSDYDTLLKQESDKIWNFVKEIGVNREDLSVFLLKRDFHNIKAAIKAVLTSAPEHGIYVSGGTIAPDTIREAVAKRDFSALPKNMADAAKTASEVFLKTGDGQACDIIIDRAALIAVKEAGRASDIPMIAEYAELTAALSDIKIAVRSCALSKNEKFLRDALAPCDTLNIETLCRQASKGTDELYSYLSVTPYAAAADAISVSYSEFEKWCDNLIMNAVSAQKYNSFTIAPIAAYILARENEISAVRIILSGKKNGLSEDSIRERLRDMYV